jgi:cob(I)alamin adenosyltransferase
MIQNLNELEVCKRRLTKLQNRIEQIVIHPKKSRRAKEMELAGVRGMIEQLQQEIQSYELAQIQQSIHVLKDELWEIDSANLQKIVQKTLDVLEEMTNVLQPTFPLQAS